MKSSAEKIAQAVLYEGYILYPYRPSTKNQQRWTFGGLYPPAWCEKQQTGDRPFLLTECLFHATPTATLEARVRFLQLVDRQVEQASGGDFKLVDSLKVGNKMYRPWQEATDRAVEIGARPVADLAKDPLRQTFSFGPAITRETIPDETGNVAGALIHHMRAIHGFAELSVSQLDESFYKLSLRVSNSSDLGNAEINREAALMCTMASTHVLLEISGGQFVSMTDPPAHAKEAADACKNIGVWPVLAGEVGDASVMFASPIILYDYPQIAPESPGDLFDGGEIDEILSLRVMTLTDQEKQEVAAIDPKADQLLQRTETLAREQLMNLHGTLRNARPLGASDIFAATHIDRPPLSSIRRNGVDLKAGDRVRLHPKGGADAVDLVLDGMTARIASIEQDYEDRIHIAVTLDADPGADLGATGKPGHRFFFRVDEVEPVGAREEISPRMDTDEHR